MVPVDEVTDEETTDDSDDNRDGECGCGFSEGDTSYEDDSFETFTKDSDEGKEEHCVFSRFSSESFCFSFFHDLGNLEFPFRL